MYEQQLDRENAAKTHLENDISRTTELAKSFREELVTISYGANRKQQLVDDLNMKVLTYSRDKTMLQTQLTAIKIKMDNLEKHNELILRQRNELTKLLLSQSDTRHAKQAEQ